MKLPSVYANKIDKKINNTLLCRFSGVEQHVCDKRELLSKFDRNGYVDRLRVKINDVDEVLILYKDDYFITINNKRIYLKDILFYEIKK